MKTRWKALASAAIAAALVIAPLTVAGASAHTGDLHASAVCDTETGTYAVTYTMTLSNVPEGRVGTTMWRIGGTSFDATPTSNTGLTLGPVTSTGNETVTLGTASLPGDTSGNGPWVYAFTTWHDGQNNAITKGSDSRVEGLTGDCAPPKKVYVCKYVGTPGVDERLQTGNNPINPSIESIKGNFPDGHVIVAGDTFTDQHGKSVVLALDTGQTPPTIEDCGPPAPDDVIPMSPVVKDLCETENDHYGLPEVTDGIDYSRDGLDIVATLQDGFAFGDLPQGWVLNEDGTATFAFNADQFTDVNCEQEVPLPALFSADPVPPTCDTAGGLPDLTELFPNVTLAFDRPFDGPGVYTLTATAAAGYGFPGGETSVSRDITVAGAIGHQFENSEAPCFLASVPQPPAPTFTDECGTANDGYSVPADTEQYVYDVADNGDSVTINANLRGDDVWAEGSVIEWSFAFTDTPCATPTPDPTPTPTPPALASTGGLDMMPWGIGAAAMLLAGAALLITRRLVRR